MDATFELSHRNLFFKPGCKLGLRSGVALCRWSLGFQQVSTIVLVLEVPHSVRLLGSSY
jgi:hypothetical protein